jgi:hypothetical protein
MLIHSTAPQPKQARQRICRMRIPAPARHHLHNRIHHEHTKHSRTPNVSPRRRSLFERAEAQYCHLHQMLKPCTLSPASLHDRLRFHPSFNRILHIAAEMPHQPGSHHRQRSCCMKPPFFWENVLDVAHTPPSDSCLQKLARSVLQHICCNGAGVQEQLSLGDCCDTRAQLFHLLLLVGSEPHRRGRQINAKLGLSLHSQFCVFVCDSALLQVRAPRRA